VAGNKMDEAVVQYVKRKHNFLIGEQTAEVVKMTIGAVYPDEERQSMKIRGRDLVTGIPKSLEISSDEVREALKGSTDTIVETVKLTLESTPPELVADIVDKGIVMVGGGALLKNLDVLLKEVTGVPVRVADDPISAVALGAGHALDDPELLKNATIAR
jgi:rod shape-determining protein MreB